MKLAKALGRRFDLEPPEACPAVNDLAREIRELDRVGIGQADSFRAAARECADRRNAQSSDSDYQY